MLHEPRLIFADDDPAFRQTVVEILEPYFDTLAVESGEQAIEIVNTYPVDLAIFDMHMHELTGLETIQLLRSKKLMLPCILMSGNVTPEIELEAERLNTYSVIRKPPQKSDLINTIQRALEV